MSIYVDTHGNSVEVPEGMASPVQCLRCGEVYDLQAVTVTSRYADCSCYTTPCCGKAVDDREQVSLPAFRRLLNPFGREAYKREQMRHEGLR